MNPISGGGGERRSTVPEGSFWESSFELSSVKRDGTEEEEREGGKEEERGGGREEERVGGTDEESEGGREGGREEERD